MKTYRFGFDALGLVLFATIMLPNIIWFALPAQNDILRKESVTPIIDTIASIAQVLGIAALCLIISRNRDPFRLSALIVVTAVFCAAYYLGWIAYYCGNVSAVVVLDLCVSPCAALICFALDRKNYIAIAPLTVFAVCHTIFGVINFIL